MSLAMAFEVEMALSRAMDWMDALNAAKANPGFNPLPGYFSNDVGLENNRGQCAEQSANEQCRSGRDF